MFTYWLMFLIPAFAALTRRRTRITARPWYLSPDWALAWASLTVLIGYRFEVGGDWFNYLLQHYMVVGQTLGYAIAHNDPAYGALNWLSTELGWGVYGVNLVSGALFSWGLVVFCRQQPRPWLALLVAIPYLVIVVGMGYTRQGVAIGLAMLGLVALGKRDNWRFVLWIALAALFHKSAVILIPLAVLATSRGRWWTALWVGASGVLLYVLLLAEHTDALLQNYVEAEYQSSGGAIRVAMNAVPALIFLLFRKRLSLDEHTRGLWTWISLIALSFVVLLVVSPSSTAVDRVALYFIPIQLFAFSRLPDLWGGNTGPVVAYYALVQFVWLTFAQNAFAWLPYRFYPLELL